MPPDPLVALLARPSVLPVAAGLGAVVDALPGDAPVLSLTKGLDPATGEPGLEITLLDAADVTRVRTALADHEFLDAATSAQSRPVLVVEAPGELDTVVAVASTLRAEGVGVFDIALRRPSLDEVFLQLTDENRAASEEVVP